MMVADRCADFILGRDEPVPGTTAAIEGATA
jgi:hypothetical protein